MKQWCALCVFLYSYNNFECKTSSTLRTHERNPHLVLTGELCVSFMSYLEKSDRELSGAYSNATALEGISNYGIYVVFMKYTNRSSIWFNDNRGTNSYMDAHIILFQKHLNHSSFIERVTLQCYG